MDSLFEWLRHAAVKAPRFRRRLSSCRYAAILAGLSTLIAGAVVQYAHAGATPASAGRQVSRAEVAAAGTPVFELVEGQKGSPDPYTPRVLVIPAGRTVILEITDHIGGCALVTIFPGLAPDGGTVRARVPVGQTRRVVIRAAKPGQYRYHCAGNMFFGEIVARQ